MFLAGAEQNLVLWKKHSGYNRDVLDVLLQVAKSAHRLRIVILSDKKERVSFLRQQVELSWNQEIVFSEAILPLAAMDAFSWDLRRLGVRIVVFDCQNLEDNLSSIRAIRENAGDVAIIAITPDVGHGRVMAALEAGVDEILSSADARNLPMHLTEYSWSWQTTTRPVNLWGGILNSPSRTSPPDNSLPPTASVWVPWGSGPRPIRPRGVALPIPTNVLVA